MVLSFYTSMHWGKRWWAIRAEGISLCVRKTTRGHTRLASPPAPRAQKSHFISLCAAAKNRGGDIPAGPGADGSENENHRAGHSRLWATEPRSNSIPSPKPTGWCREIKRTYALNLNVWIKYLDSLESWPISPPLGIDKLDLSLPTPVSQHPS